VRVKFDLHKGSRSCLNHRTRCGSSSTHTARAHALILTTPLGTGQVCFAQRLTARSCFDCRTRCGLSLIHKRVYAFVLTTALEAGQVRFTRRLALFSILSHSVRVKLDSHESSRSCLDYRTQCWSSLIHTRAHALVLTTAFSASQVRFTQGLALLS